MSRFFACFLKDKSGVTAIEYGLIASLIAVGIVTDVTLVGTELNNTFHYVATQL